MLCRKKRRSLNYLMPSKKPRKSAHGNAFWALRPGGPQGQDWNPESTMPRIQALTVMKRVTRDDCTVLAGWYEGTRILIISLKKSLTNLHFNIHWRFSQGLSMIKNNAFSQVYVWTPYIHNKTWTWKTSTVHFPLTKENGDARLRRQPPHNLQAKAARASHVSKAGVGGSRRDDGAGHTILERDATP